MFNVCLLSFVQVNFHNLFTVQLYTNTFANDLSGKYQIIQNSIVYPCQSTAKKIQTNKLLIKKLMNNANDIKSKTAVIPSRTLLFVLGACFPCWFGQNFTVTNEDNMFAAELLFQFSYETSLDFLKL